jgi:hypothetical protein
MTELHHKRKARRKQTAEDFTPQPLVIEMLDKLPPEVFTDPSKLFCDPAAGNGNFLIEVLRRKLSNNHPPLQALSTIFSVELMADNVEECKQRLLELIDPSLHTEAKQILDHNIVCHDTLTWDFENWKSTIKKAKTLF